MQIMIVDDSGVSRHFFADLLRDAGYSDIVQAESVEEAFRIICADGGDKGCAQVDLILMDINMPGKDGIQGCRELKKLDGFNDIPVIIISGTEHLENLHDAFEAGAVDYLGKPPHKVELLARVRAALRLKTEMDRRKARERELVAMAGKLEEMNRELKRLSTHDTLTGLPNRHSFNEFLAREWRRAVRKKQPFSVIMIDIDCFKAYNDIYGHLEGDNCLRRVAKALQREVRRPGDFLARFGGEEFIALLPDTDSNGAAAVAAAMLADVAGLGIRHKGSTVDKHVTVSIGYASISAEKTADPDRLIGAADAALYKAKHEGRNQVRFFTGPL